MKKQGYLQISFGWLFAIIVGVVVLFFAVFLSSKIMNAEQTTLDAQTGKEIGILLNPLETSFESAKTTSFTVPVETRIYNKCERDEDFGVQKIQISQRSFNKWTEPLIDVSFYNKYIFSENVTEGRTFYVFSKPFEFPFKVADLIYITPSTEKYCFVNAPSAIEEEISKSNQKNLFIEECPEESIDVCFNARNCEINVYFNYIEKNGETFSFEGDALMYAAIFSDKAVYECQLERLLQRAGQLALIYKDKSLFISQRGCNTDLNTNLLELNNAVKNPDNFEYISSVAELIGQKNEANMQCRLW